MNKININIDRLYNDVISKDFSENLLNYTYCEKIDDINNYYITKKFKNYLNIIPEELLNLIEEDEICYVLKEKITNNNDNFIINYEVSIISPINIENLLKEFIIIIDIFFKTHINDKNITEYSIKISYKENDNIILIVLKKFIDLFISNILLNYINKNVVKKIENYYIRKDLLE